MAIQHKSLNGCIFSAMALEIKKSIFVMIFNKVAGMGSCIFELIILMENFS
jgi:hypothetical protein